MGPVTPPKPPVPPPSARNGGTYLRGLLPFETGEALLGRDQEIGRLLTMVRSSEFRFGYVTGQPGCGKTTILRAGLVAALEQKGRGVLYLPRPGVDPLSSVLEVTKRQFRSIAGIDRMRTLHTALEAIA